MDATEVTDALFRYFNAYRGYTYQLVNAYVFKWESDFFCIANSGYSYEIEVKVSRADYFADFNKVEKHRILQQGKPFWMPVGKGYTAYRASKNMGYAQEVLYKPYTHLDYTDADPLYVNIKRVDPGDKAPNRFYFAVPNNLIEPNEVPDYAGLIYVAEDKRRKPKIIKKAPSLHNTKKDFTKTLLQKYYWAYLNSLDKPKAGKNFEFPNQRTNGQKMVRTT